MSGPRFTYSFQLMHLSPRWGFDFPATRLVEAARSAGFTGVGVDLHLLRRFRNQGTDLADLRAMIHDAGLVCTDVIAVTAGPDGEANVATARELAVAAGALDAKLGITTIGGELAGAGSAAVRHAFRRCVDVVADAGVRVALEYLPYSPVSRVDQALSLCAEVGFERAGLLVDSFHTAVAHQWDALTGLTAEQVALVQFNDTVIPLSEDVITESRCRRRPPGEGNLDLRRFVAAVKTSGYTGVISPEVLSERIRAEGEPEALAELLWRTTVPFWS